MPASFAATFGFFFIAKARRVLDDLRGRPRALVPPVSSGCPVRAATVRSSPAGSTRSPRCGSAGGSEDRIARGCRRPSQGRAPRHVPSGFNSSSAASCMRARLAALAAHDEVGEVAAGAALVEPQRPPAGILAAVDEPVPVEVVDVAARARPHEAGRYDWRPSNRPFSSSDLRCTSRRDRSVTVASCLLLDDASTPESARLRRRALAPGAPSSRRVARTGAGPGRPVNCEILRGQARVGDLVEHVDLRPRLEPADDP